MRPEASALVTWAMGLLPVAVVALVGLLVHRSVSAPRRRRVTILFGLGAAGWLGLAGGLAHAGVLADFSRRPPPLMLLLVPTIGLAAWLASSRVGREVSRSAPLWALVGLHAFRLPLELVMHQAAREGVMPAQMSFAETNFDIFSGASAVVVAALAWSGRASRGLVLAWNAIGSALLVVIVVIAVSSLPVFRAFGDEPARLNTWVAYFPFVWLPAGLVASALFGHLVLWRRLLAADTAAPALASSAERG